MEEILHQLKGTLSHYWQGFMHPRLRRISSISSSTLIARGGKLRIIKKSLQIARW